jgi:hypothetical protein
MPGAKTVLNRDRHSQLSVNSDRIASEILALSEMPRSVNTKNYCLAIFGSLNIKRLPLRDLHTDESLLALYFGAFINIIHNYLEGYSPLQPQVAQCHCDRIFATSR